MLKWIFIYVQVDVRFRSCHCQNKVSILITVSDDRVEHAEPVALTIVHEYYVHSFVVNEWVDCFVILCFSSAWIGHGTPCPGSNGILGAPFNLLYSLPLYFRSRSRLSCILGIPTITPVERSHWSFSARTMKPRRLRSGLQPVFCSTSYQRLPPVLLTSILLEYYFSDSGRVLSQRRLATAREIIYPPTEALSPPL